MGVDLLEYTGYNGFIKVGIDKETEIKLNNKFRELLEEEDSEPFHIFEILADNGIVIE